jgi:hypothetical protein
VCRMAGDENALVPVAVRYREALVPKADMVELHVELRVDRPMDDLRWSPKTGQAAKCLSGIKASRRSRLGVGG